MQQDESSYIGVSILPGEQDGVPKDNWRWEEVAEKRA